MSRWHYVASAYKSTVVSGSLTANFTSSEETNLIICKSNRLEVNTISDGRIVPIQEIPLYGIILCVEKLRFQGLDLLLLVTEPYTLSLMEYSPTELSIRECIDLRETNKIKTDHPPVFAMDIYQRAFCAQFYKGIVKVCILGNFVHFNTRIEEAPVLDMAFADNEANLHLVILYDKGAEHIVNIYQVSLEDCSAIALEQYYRAPSPSSKLIILPHSTIAVVSDNILAVYNEDGATSYEHSFSTITASTKLEINKWVMGNREGELFLLVIDDQFNISVTVLGRVPVATTLSPIGPSTIYASSSSGDSNVVSIVNDEDLSIGETFDNIGPIHDFSVKYAENGLMCSIISCSGSEQDGSIRDVSKGITVYPEFEVPIGYVLGIWSLSLGENGAYSHLIISNVNQTAVMELRDETLSVFSKKEEPSLHFSVCPVGILQVTAQSIYLFDRSFNLKFKHDMTEGKATCADAYEDILAVSVSGNLIITYKVLEDKIEEIGRLPTTEEIACIAAFKGLVAVGLWVDISVSIYSTALDHVWTDQLREDILPRSVLFDTLEGIDYLFVGLADGHLIIYTLPGFSRYSIVLGNRQIKLSKFSMGDKSYVFAACDQPAVIYSFYQRIFHAVVNTDSVDHMAPFQNADFPDCIALVAGSELQMVSIEEISRISSKAYPMGVTLRRVYPIQDFYMCIGTVQDKISRGLLLNNEDFAVRSYVQMEPNEVITCVAIRGDLLFLGTEVYIDEKVDPITGYILLYRLENGEFALLDRVDMNHEVTSLLTVGKNELVVGLKNNLEYWRYENGSLDMVNSCYKMNYILCADSYEDYVAVVDIVKLILVYKSTSKDLELLCKSFTAQWPTAIKMISEEKLFLADMFGHIILYEIASDTRICAIGGYFLGENINCFRQGSFVQRSHEDILGEIECFLFGTTKGCLGVVASLPENVHLILSHLQNSLGDLFPSKELLNLHKFRTPDIRGENIQWNGFIDGDFIELFLVIQPSQQVAVMKEVNQALGSSITVQDLQKLVLSLSKIH